MTAWELDQGTWTKRQAGDTENRVREPIEWSWRPGSLGEFAVRCRGYLLTANAYGKAGPGDSGVDDVEIASCDSSWPRGLSIVLLLARRSRRSGSA